MTLQRYWTGTIDGTALEEAPGLPCLCDVSGHEGLISPFTGQTIFALESTPHIQYVYAPLVGVIISNIIEYCPNALLAELLTKLNARIAADESFDIALTDGITPIAPTVKCFMPDWFSRGAPSGAYVEKVTFNFVTVG
jgi:hypothetical protein